MSVFGSGIKTLHNPISRTAKGSFSGTRSCSLPLLCGLIFIFGQTALKRGDLLFHGLERSKRKKNKIKHQLSSAVG